MIEFVLRYDPASRDRLPRPETAQEACARLIEGNRKVVALLSRSQEPGEHRDVISFDPENWGHAGESGVVPMHQPFAAVLGCSDARVPMELVFRQTLNDLFVVRLAGNVLSSEGLGSLAYALRQLAGSMRLLVVLGHTHCGAVTAAVDSYLSPSEYPNVAPHLGLRSLVDKIYHAVRLSERALQGASNEEPGSAGYRDRLIDLAVVINAALNAMTLRTLANDVVGSSCEVVFGVFDLASAATWAPDLEADPAGWADPGLAPPPASFDDLARLAEALAGREAP